MLGVGKPRRRRILQPPPTGIGCGRQRRRGEGVKKIGFLSFGHWSPAHGSGTRSASDALLQSIELAVAAEELGADGAYVRVHHFARQLASPFPLLAAIGARTARIEIGTAVIDMRYENPFYMAEDAGRGRSHRRRPAAARHQPRLARAGHRRLPPLRLCAGRGRDRRRHGPPPRRALPRPARRRGLRPAEPAADVPQSARPAPPRAAFRGAARAHLVGRRHRRHRRLGGGAGDEPAELDAEVRRDRRALPHPAGEADPRLPGSLEGRRPCPRAPGLGQPQHLRPRQRPGPRLFRPLRRERGHDRLSRREHARDLRPLLCRRARRARATPSPRTRRSPRPTRCC